MRDLLRIGAVNPVVRSRFLVAQYQTRIERIKERRCGVSNTPNRALGEFTQSAGSGIQLLVETGVATGSVSFVVFVIFGRLQSAIVCFFQKAK